MPGAKRAGENGQRVAFVGFQFVFRRQQGHAVQRAAQDFLQHGALFGVEGGLRGGFLYGGLNLEKQAGSIVYWRMLAKPHPGFADPPLFFQTAPISRNGLFRLKCAAICLFYFQRSSEKTDLTGNLFSDGLQTHIEPNEKYPQFLHHRPH